MANKDRIIVLLVLNHWENPKKPGTGFELRVVHVVSADGKSRGAGVEKVYFYDEGRKAIGKVIQRKDFSTIKERWGEVLSLLEKPGPIPPLPEPEPLGGGEGLGGGSLGGGRIINDSKPDPEPPEEF